MVRPVLAAVAFAAVTCPAVAHAAPSAPYTLRGTVTDVVDVVTLDVRLTNGRIVRMRLIGLTGPPSGSCGHNGAIADVVGSAAGKLVWLVGDSAEPSRDRQGDLLGYAILPGGQDLGLALVQRGDATLTGGKRRFAQLASYAAAQAAAKAGSLGVWACGQASPGKPRKRANPSPAGGSGNDGGQGSRGSSVARSGHSQLSDSRDDSSAPGGAEGPPGRRKPVVGA
jgi:endonuclease YncB( thermonuclease family)